MTWILIFSMVVNTYPHCNPRVGREMRDVPPFLVLSPRIFNDTTSSVIGLPMTCHQPKSFDWRPRKARRHPLGALSTALFVQVRERLNQIIQVAGTPTRE